MFKPTQDYILVLPVKRVQSTVLEVISSEKYTQGTVVAVGPGKRDRKQRIRPLTVQVGDFITYGDINRGYDFYPEYEEDGVRYRILQEADICFIAEPGHEAHGLTDAEIAKIAAQKHEPLVINMIPAFDSQASGNQRIV